MAVVVWDWVSLSLRPWVCEGGEVRGVQRGVWLRAGGKGS